MSDKRKKVLQLLAELDEEVDELPDEEPEEGGDEEPEDPPAKVAKVDKALGKKGEIARASEATMQAALEELRQVKTLLAGKDPDKAKARGVLDHVYELLGIE